jgi:hypothetical protein
MKKATQLERVLAKARSYDGVCQADFAHPVCDGADPVTRVGARLYELDQQGYSFEVIGWRNRCKIFRLIADDGVEGTGGVSDATAQVAQTGLGAATAALPDEGDGSRKAPVRQGDAGLITRASAAGSLNAESDLRLFEPPVPSALKEAA